MDFIETEEDAEAVESAVVKIQSTFRGKKIRSKLNKQTPSPANNEAAAEIQSRPTETGASRKTDETGGGGGGTKNQRDEEELKRGVATMQVNDNNNNHSSKPANVSSGGERTD